MAEAAAGAPAPAGRATQVERDAPGAAPLQLVSWNVAGWASMHELVRRHYSGFEDYLRRLGRPAVFCAQEVKVQDKDLKSEVAAKELGAVLPGYRSYWAFSEKKGFQGVATWVRDDVPCLGATQKVFGDPELDQLGRALLSDHGSFAVLNVYVPFVGGGGEGREGRSAEGLALKRRFLEALGKRMGELRASGRRVLLCGDLNLTHRPLDQKAGRRLLRVDSAGFLEVPAAPAAGADEGEALDDSPAQDCSGGAAAPGDRLGPFEDWAGQWVPVRDLCERAKVPARHLAAGGECVHAREAECVAWLRDLVARPAEGGAGAPAWADVFAEVHPEARDRFTCWGQSANLRYVNAGTRIDYVIADRATFEECVAKSPSSCLRGAGGQGLGAAPATVAQAAVNAATNFGGWHRAAVSGIAQGDGLSLQTDNMRLNDSQFPAAPHTGLLYTPPSYSDHIPVAVLLSERLLEWRGDAAPPLPSSVPEVETKQCQPWRAQRSIASFFGAKPVATPQRASAGASSGPAKRRKC